MLLRWFKNNEKKTENEDITYSQENYTGIDQMQDAASPAILDFFKKKLL